MSRFSELYPGKYNFCRVFELPDEYPNGFCFDGGKPVTIVMVDWFHPWPEHMVPMPDIETWEECKSLLLPFLQNKRYVRVGKKYILITEFGESMLFEK